MSASNDILARIKELAGRASHSSTTTELIQPALKRILYDKLLLSLAIVGLLGIFVGGFASKDQMTSSVKPSESKAEPATGSIVQNSARPVNPTLAIDFVKFWMGNAMNYAAASALRTHAEAAHWMTPDALQVFQSALWTPDIAQGISDGRIVGAFQPISVQAEAINPDGSIVVGITGTLILQCQGRPSTQQLQTDVLVANDPDNSGLRIAGLYNRFYTASSYAAPSYTAPSYAASRKAY
jgi:hypothetical protein